MEDLIAEAKDLAKSGIRELILVAQETTMYGKDIYGEKRLHILLKDYARLKTSNGLECYTVIRKKYMMN